MSKTATGVIRPATLRAPNPRWASAAAIGLSAALLAGAAQAQEAPAEDGEIELQTLRIEDRTADVSPYAQKGAPYKARVSGDERHTRPLAETPQTITVLTQSQILDSGATDLKAILAAQPGVTVGTGENGNAFGDRYIIRGQEAKSDVFVDGLRDPGMTIRESFAVEQIEITKGPNSSFAGRGTAGGAVNAITKQASTDYDFGKVSAGVGTDAYLRATADINQALSDQAALRVNALYATSQVPERDPADRERLGVAASLLLQPSERLSVTLDYYGLRAEDSPDLGGYLVTDASGARVPAKGVPAYVQDEDFLRSVVNTGTARLRWELADDVFVTNIARYGSASNAYVTTGVAARTTGTGNPGGVYATSALDAGHTGWQEVRYLADQANLHVNSELLGGKNELILGFEYSNHKVDSGTYTRTTQGPFNCSLTASTVLNAFCITGSDEKAVSNINTLAQRNWSRSPYATRKWQVETWSASVMDTADLSEHLTLFAGLRYDHFDFTLGTYSATTGGLTTASPYAFSDGLWNGHLGLTYKAGPATLYVTASTAQDINGGESDTGTSSGYGGLVVFNGAAAGAAPERSVNFEAGMKFDLMDGDLLLTAAAFQTTKSGVMEGADYNTVGTFNTGRFRVRGLEFGVVGNVTERLSLQAGLTVMDSEVLESSNTGLSAAQLALGATNVGKDLANFAKVQASFQARYQLSDRLAVGGTVSHKGVRYGGQPDTAAVFVQGSGGFTYSQPVPAYTVGDLFAEVKFSSRVDLRVNVGNVTNADYYTAVYRAGFFLYQGDKRSVTATLNVKF